MSISSLRGINPADVGVIILGHGSREEEANTEFQDLVHAYKKEWPEWDIEYAQVELAPPDLKTALRNISSRRRRIVIVPLFLFTSGHVKNDIPLVIHSLKAEFPKHEYLVTGAIGPEPRMAEFMMKRLKEAVTLDSVRIAKTGVVVVGRGASDSDANSDFFKLVRLFEESGTFAFVQPTFIGITKPLLPQTLESAARLRPEELLILPYFLFKGRLINRINKIAEEFATAYPWIKTTALPSLGFDTLFFELITEKIARVLSGGMPLPCVGCEYRQNLPGLPNRVGGLKALLWSLRHLETHTQSGPHEFPHKNITKHVLVCTNVDCAEKNSIALVSKLRQQVKESGRYGDIKITRTSCMGRCGEGPAVVVYPDGIWYQKVGPEDAQELFQEHLLNDRIVPRLVDTIMQ